MADPVGVPVVRPPKSDSFFLTSNFTQCGNIEVGTPTGNAGSGRFSYGGNITFKITRNESEVKYCLHL